MSVNGVGQIRTDSQLEDLLRQFNANRRTIPISFRDRLRFLNNADRYSHLIHPYPAKLLVHIPYFFLSNSILSKPGDTVLDPFCGSGTVLLETLLARRRAIGADINPLARLISKVKTSPPDPGKLARSITRLRNAVKTVREADLPDVVNLEYWFYPHVIKKLLGILASINEIADYEIRSFFLVCLSSCVRRVSLADPRLAVPVRLKVGQYPKGHWLSEKTDQHLRKLKRIDVDGIFFSTVEENSRRLMILSKTLPADQREVNLAIDSRDLRITTNGSSNGLGHTLPSNSVDCVITSPPYVGSQKYTRATSLSLGWLGLCPSSDLRKLEGLSLGREHYPKASYENRLETGIKAAEIALDRVNRINPLRAHIAASYLVEIRDAFREISRVLRRHGHFILVTANNQLCGMEFKVHEYVQILAEELGFTLKLRLVDEIRSRGLMTKRNKTASLITREWILLFQKD
jgi:DNA modification methylase